jgi:hypothetical protein
MTIQEQLQRDAKGPVFNVVSGLVVVALALAYFHPVSASDRVFFYWLLALMLTVDVIIAVVLIVTKMRCPRCKGSLSESWWAIRSGNGPGACPHCHVSFQEPYMT